MLGEPFQAVAAQGLQQPVPGRAAVQLGGHQGTVDQVQQQPEDVGRLVMPVGDRVGGGGVEAAMEHRKLGE